MGLADWQVTLLAAALPVAAGAVKGLASTVSARGFESRAKRHLELLRDLPAGVEATDLTNVVGEELRVIGDRADFRLHRKIKRGLLVGVSCIWAVLVYPYAVVIDAFNQGLTNTTRTWVGLGLVVLGTCGVVIWSVSVVRTHLWRYDHDHFRHSFVNRRQLGDLDHRGTRRSPGDDGTRHLPGCASRLRPRCLAGLRA